MRLEKKALGDQRAQVHDSLDRQAHDFSVERTMVSMKQTARRYLKALGEFLSIAAPIICLFDCVVLPVMAVVLPFIGLNQMVHGISDQFLTMLVLAICLPVLVPGILKHKNVKVALLLSLAACLMLFTNMLGEALDHTFHAILTACTSILFLRANYLNRKLLSCKCSHH